MSKLAAAISYFDTGERSLKGPKFNVVRINQHFEDTMSPHLVPAKIYAVEATVGSKVVIEHSLIDNPVSAISQAVKDVRKAVIEDVFGEFRPLLMELRMSLYNHDTDRAKEVLNRLENQMFHEGI